MSVVKLREVVWSLVYLADRRADEWTSRGTVLAAVVVLLGAFVIALLGQAVHAGWSK